MKDTPSLAVTLLEQEKISGYIINLLLTDHLKTRPEISLFLKTLQTLAESNMELFITILFQLTTTEQGVGFLDRHRTLWFKDEVLKYRWEGSRQHIMAWLVRKEYAKNLVDDVIRYSFWRSQGIQEDVMMGVFNDSVDWDDEKETSAILYLARVPWGRSLISNLYSSYSNLMLKEAFNRACSVK